MSQDPILISPGLVTTVTLNRPEVGNLLDNQALDRLAEAFEQLAADEATRAVILRGAGPTFCTGRRSGFSPGTKPTAWRWRAELSKIIRVNEALRRIPAVTVAAVHGDALGFGCGLAVQCDLTIASKHARFAFPEVNAGLPPLFVLSYLGHFIPRKRALELLLTAASLNAETCQQLGLVNSVVEPEDLDQEVEKLVATVIAKDALAVRTTKQVFAELYDGHFVGKTSYMLNFLSTYLTHNTDEETSG